MLLSKLNNKKTVNSDSFHCFIQKYSLMQGWLLSHIQKLFGQKTKKKLRKSSKLHEKVYDLNGNVQLNVHKYIDTTECAKLKEPEGPNMLKRYLVLLSFWQLA